MDRSLDFLLQELLVLGRGDRSRRAARRGWPAPSASGGRSRWSSWGRAEARWMPPARCAARRTGCSRRLIAGVRDARRSWTRGEWMRGEVRRDWRLRALSASSVETLAVPSFSARATMTSSSSFWRAKASHPSSSLSRLVSAARSSGQCSSEHDGATITRSGPKASTNGRAVSTSCWRSALQMLRPSTRPREKTVSDGFFRRISAPWRVPRTRSTWSPETGSFSARSRLSPRSPK